MLSVSAAVRVPSGGRDLSLPLRWTEKLLGSLDAGSRSVGIAGVRRCSTGIPGLGETGPRGSRPADRTYWLTGAELERISDLRHSLAERKAILSVEPVLHAHRRRLWDVPPEERREDRALGLHVAAEWIAGRRVLHAHRRRLWDVPPEGFRGSPISRSAPAE